MIAPRLARTVTSAPAAFLAVSLGAALAAAAGARAAGTAPDGAAVRPPRLAVVIVVDQMCQHHIERFRDLYTGGLHRLLEEGAVFANARHDHAGTFTSPGHTTITTGCVPAHHGIVANAWYDRTSGFAVTYSARDERWPPPGRPGVAGASPSRMLRDGVGDWLKARSPASKVYSVAVKDYAAALVGGRHPDAAFWYDAGDGSYGSSTWYVASYPAWVDSFNARHPADEYRDEVWTRSRAPQAYERSRADASEAESDGVHTTFPYRVAEAATERQEGFYEFLRRTPFADELTLRFATALVRAEDLGADDATDLLFVGCSAADFIGHAWGPYSQEDEDYYLRLDGYLDAFFRALDARVGPGDYTVVLTSDHGVQPIPEGTVGRSRGAERVSRARYHADLDAAAAEVSRETGAGVPLVALRDLGIVLDPEACAASGLPEADLRARLAGKIRAFQYVEDVFTYDELAAPDGAALARAAAERGGDTFRLCRNSFHPDRSADLCVVFRQHRLVSGGKTGTTHGSPHDYDRHVPLVFWGRGIVPGERGGAVRTVDVAPTIAGLAGFDPPEGIDGRDLTPMLRVADREGGD